MDDEKIKILGAREHNLQNVDLEIPNTTREDRSVRLHLLSFRK